MNEQSGLESIATNQVSLILGGARSGKSALAEKLAGLRAGESVLYVATLLPYDQEMRDRIKQHRQQRPASWLTLEEPYNLRASVEKSLANQTQTVVLLDCLTLWTSNLILRESQLATDLIERNGMYGEIYDDEVTNRSTSKRFTPPQLDTDREEDITSDLQYVPSIRPHATPDYNRLEREILAELNELVQFLRQKKCGFIVVSNEVGLGLVPPYPIGRVYRDLLGRVNQQLAALADEVFMVYAGIPVELKKLQAEFYKKPE